MFERFGDYMYSLLMTPLKKGKKALNQFYIFLQVMGLLFDDIKQRIFRVRQEAMVISASEVMLPEHGKDRNMPRLKGESIEGYRVRLSMKAIIAEMAGTVPGIQLAMSALGYPEAYVEPYYLHDPERWAEFLVHLGQGNGQEVRDLLTVYQEVNLVKEGSSKLAYLVVTDNDPLESSLHLGCVLTSYTELLLNTAEEIVLVLDREFDQPLRLGVVVSSYSEQILNSADDLVLVRDRDFSTPLRLGLALTSYTEQILNEADELVLSPDRRFESNMALGTIVTSYKEEHI